MFDFTTIRGDSVEAQRSAFEQLVCRLAKLDGRGGLFIWDVKDVNQRPLLPVSLQPPELGWKETHDAR